MARLSFSPAPRPDSGRTSRGACIQAGARFVLSARNEDALQRAAKELGESRVIVADLSKTGEPERLAREAGEVDVLVSNAGSQ